MHLPALNHFHFGPYSDVPDSPRSHVDPMVAAAAVVVVVLETSSVWEISSTLFYLLSCVGGWVQLQINIYDLFITW